MLRRPRLGLQKLVADHPPHLVTATGDEEPAHFPVHDIWSAVKHLYATGLHPAIALHIRHRGRVVMDRTIGHLEHEPGQPAGAMARPDSLFSLFSASKIVTSALVLALCEDGVLALDRPLVAWLPEIDRHGKGAILLRHLLQHTAGIPDMPPVHDIADVLARGRIDIARLAELPLQSVPGQKVAYHSMTWGFLLHEIVERATGKPIRQLLRERLTGPLGLDQMDYGVPEPRLPEVARHAVTGPPVPGFMAKIFSRNIGVPFDKAIEISNRPEFLTGVLPMANVIAPPRQTGAFMDMLLNGGQLGGVRVLQENTARQMHRDVTPWQIDGTIRLPLSYGLGVMMGHRLPSLYGPNTGGAFGHLGLSSVVVWADPARQLAVAFLNTGKPMAAPGMVLWYRVLERISSLVPRGHGH